MGAFSSFAHQVLELCEDLFDRIEVGTLGRQEQEFGFGPPDRGADGGSFMAAQIVHDDDIAR